jgi:hypothetical protein
LLEVRVPTRHAVALQHDVVLHAAADSDRAHVEHEAATEKRRLLRVDDDETVVALRDTVGPPKGLFHNGSDSSFLLGLAHEFGLVVGCRLVGGRGRPSFF